MIFLPLKFITSRQNDIFAFLEFLKQDQNKKLLLDFIGLVEVNDSVIHRQAEEFARDFYKKRKKDIERSTLETESAWNKKKSFFYKRTSELFPLDFKKDISAMPTIWPMCGRFFEKNLITFPFDKKSEEGVFVIAHELLHFIFYEYISICYGFSEDKIFSQEVWDFSEVLNVLIQNQKTWKDEFEITAKPHPNHSVLYEKMEHEWRVKSDIDYMIGKFLV
jgi:hypothetical protein